MTCTAKYSKHSDADNTKDFTTSIRQANHHRTLSSHYSSATANIATEFASLSSTFARRLNSPLDLAPSFFSISSLFLHFSFLFFLFFSFYFLHFIFFHFSFLFQLTTSFLFLLSSFFPLFLFSLSSSRFSTSRLLPSHLLLSSPP